MDQDRAKKQRVQEHEVMDPHAEAVAITEEEGRAATSFRAVIFFVVGMMLFATGCATGTSGGANRSVSSISGRGALGGFPGKCMGGAGATGSGSTASQMGSCAYE